MNAAQSTHSASASAAAAAPVPVSPERLNHPRSLAAFRGTKLLVGGYLGISVLTLVAIVLLRNDSADVNSAVWVRGTIVVASALVTYLCAIRAARGSRSAYRRLRVITGVMAVAIAAIIALPGAFPVWMKAEQALCGVLLIAVAALVNGKHLRSLFAA
ncbi:hypothetical protein ACFPFX_28390 [Streptomyces mauvecolor]|uniref:Integral membrane protein n=1 Tax=Streptomyces mauvecolor TaxID=58345 RepID=A0ABV9UST2_9ACTN